MPKPYIEKRKWVTESRNSSRDLRKVENVEGAGAVPGVLVLFDARLVDYTLFITFFLL